MKLNGVSSETIPESSLAGAVISFGRMLKEAGFAVSTPSVMDALEGILRVGPGDLQAFKTALKATFMTRIEESAAFERLFNEFWIQGMAGKAEQDLANSELGGDDSPPDGETSEEGPFPAEAVLSASQEQEAWGAQAHVMYSPREILREHDFKDVPAGYDERMARIIREILAPLFRRVGVRKRAVPYGTSLDFRKLMRRNVRYGGEIVELPRLKPRRRIRRLVFLCDVSGSMNPYLRFMLRFIKEIQQVPSRVETFVFATRLHRITPFLSRLPFAAALQEVSDIVKDWSGGTRIGSCLHEFNAFRGGGMLGSSTVLLIHSDGWDRGDIALLESQMARIHRRVYRILWINPLLGGPSYEPTCRGMQAALPYIDSFIPGHNIAGLERLAGTLRGIL
ncbi:MAG: VWA domain-containing protein [Desulfomonile tiedjei]|nr:VWA domain-containing protein [Desulfomonile tiedjei]